MANRVILSRKEQFDREIAAYRGDDPLKLRYEFLLWLDSNFGKDKVIDIFTSTLEEALNTHWNDVRYKEDHRLIELQMIYATLQPNPLNVYQSYYDRGIAQQSSVLYVNWANHLAASGDFAGADKIFKIGSEKTASAKKTELNKAFEKFLAIVGRKFLDGEIPTEKDANCVKCRVQPSAVPAPAAEDVQAIEMNPGKAGCWEDFQTAVAYFDPPDTKSIRMYPKDKVYKDAGKEYSLEEIKAAEYFEKLKKKEQLQVQKLKEKTSKMSIMSFDPPCEPDTVLKDGAFPTPLLPCSGKEDSIAAQSFTTRTKLAMHLVQDMWSSPTPEVQLPILAKNEENKQKTAFPIYMDENPDTPKAAEKKPPAPFQVFADSPDEVAKNNKNPVSLAKKSTVKKNGLQAKSNVLSERNLKNGEVSEEPKAAVKQQLHFESDDANEILAKKIGGTTIPDTSFQPFGGFKPLFPVEQGKDDFSDITCNTKAFNFALPSSTPVQQRKSLAPYHSAHQDIKSNTTPDERPSCHTQQNLSVILEASKERCSSSGSSTGSSQPRTPAFPAKSKSFPDSQRDLSNSVMSPLRTSQTCRSDLSYSSNGPGTAPANRSFTWLSNWHTLKSNIAIAKPNRSQNNEEFYTPSTCTSSYLKFRPSSGKLGALNSIKENYIDDRSRTCLLKSFSNCDMSRNSSSIDPVPRISRNNSGAMLLELVRVYKSKKESSVSTKTDNVSYSQHSLEDTSKSIFGDTINDQESILGYDGGKKPCDHIRREFCESRNIHLVQPLPYSDLVDIKSNPIRTKKFERKGYLLKTFRHSVGFCVSKPVKSQQKNLDANVKSKAIHKRYPHKQNRRSIGVNDSSKLNRTENIPFCTSSSPSFDATNEPLISSVEPDIPKYNARDPRIKNLAKRKSGLRSSKTSSINVHLSSSSFIEIRRCSIRLSPINVVDESLQSVRLQSVKRKRGRPKKELASARKNSVDTVESLQTVRLQSVKRKRGRPKKELESARKNSVDTVESLQTVRLQSVKRKRGRPKKELESARKNSVDTVESLQSVRLQSAKRKRGCPKKELVSARKNSVDTVESLQSVRLQSAKRKRGCPKKELVSTRKSSVDTVGEESPFKLCNTRKDPPILSMIGSKRKLSKKTAYINCGNNKEFKSRMKLRRNYCRISSNVIGNHGNKKHMTTSKVTPSSMKSNKDEFVNDKKFKFRMKLRRNSCRIKPKIENFGNKHNMKRSSSSLSSMTLNKDGMNNPRNMTHPAFRIIDQLNRMRAVIEYRLHSSESKVVRSESCSVEVEYVPKQLIAEDLSDIDPFCPLMNDKLLTMLNFPQTHHMDGFQVVNTNVPVVSKNIRLGNDAFTTYGDLGKGAYARVVRASCENTNVALKIEKPACKWEFYIAKEIQRRVDPKTRSGFMDINTAYIFSNGSVLVTEWAKHGSLLNIINLYKQHTGKVLEPVLSLHFAIEVTRAVEYLHKCKIIHGDIKPDNFVVRSLPTVSETEPCLMLIDFGRSIDMSLFPEGTKFCRVVTTEGFQCNEMKEQRSWTYQTDLYGLAGTVHCLLVGEYMKVTKKNDEWKLQKGLPRNIKRELWDPIFHQLLNVPSCDQLPNLTEIRKTLEGAFADYNPYVKVQYFNHISNIVMGK